MKKIHFLILITLTYSFNSFSCSPPDKSGFCITAENADVIIKGVITEVNNDFAKIYVHKVYKGIENRDTITLWGKDTIITFWGGTSCEEQVNMTALNTGKVNDSIIITLFKPDSNSYNWINQNDYSAPYYHNFNSYSILKWTIDSVKGSIISCDCSPSWYIREMSQIDFDNTWENEEFKCFKLASTNEKTMKSTINSYPNPFNETFTIDNITHSTAKSFIIKIYDLFGKVAYSREILQSSLLLNDEIIINSGVLQKGIYILEIEGIGRTKIIKE